MGQNWGTTASAEGIQTKSPKVTGGCDKYSSGVWGTARAINNFVCIFYSTHRILYEKWDGIQYESVMENSVPRE